jgi:hypothetical protein
VYNLIQAEQLIPYILHKEGPIRCFAVEYFAETIPAYVVVVRNIKNVAEGKEFKRIRTI